MKRVGFSMTEFLLYIGIMTLVMGCATTVLFYDYMHAVKALRSLHEVCMLSAATDVCAHDIYEASDDRDMWYQVDEQMVILRSGKEDVEFALHQSKLIRVAGHYDRAGKHWIKRSISVIATGVTSASFVLIHDTHTTQRIRAVQCAITGSGTPVIRYVALRNGRST